MQNGGDAFIFNDNSKARFFSHRLISTALQKRHFFPATFIGTRLKRSRIHHPHLCIILLDLQRYSSPYSWPPPCSRSVCLQYLLRHRHLQNVFELALSQRPSECAPRLPEAALSTEHAAGSEQPGSIDTERLVAQNPELVTEPWLMRRHQDNP